MRLIHEKHILNRIIDQGAFEDEEHLKAWLIRMTINKCQDLFRASWFKTSRPLETAQAIMAPEDQGLMEKN